MAQAAELTRECRPVSGFQAIWLSWQVVVASQRCPGEFRAAAVGKRFVICHKVPGRGSEQESTQTDRHYLWRPACPHPVCNRGYPVSLRFRRARAIQLSSLSIDWRRSQPRHGGALAELEWSSLAQLQHPAELACGAVAVAVFWECFSM